MSRGTNKGRAAGTPRNAPACRCSHRHRAHPGCRTARIGSAPERLRPFPSRARAATLPAMSDTATDSDARLVAGLWQVVARHGWHGLTMRRVSEASGVPLGELRRRCPTPLVLLALHRRVTDRQVLEGTIPDTGGDSPRDRL